MTFWAKIIQEKNTKDLRNLYVGRVEFAQCILFANKISVRDKTLNNN